jgi:hypothetical protein
MGHYTDGRRWSEEDQAWVLDDGTTPSSASPACSIAGPAVRRVDGKTLLIIDGTEHVITTDQALALAENLNAAAFLAGDY